MKFRFCLILTILFLTSLSFANNTKSNDTKGGYTLYALQGDSFIGNTLNFFGISKKKNNAKSLTSNECPSGGFICMGTNGVCSSDSCFWSYCKKNSVMVDARLTGIISDSTRYDIFKLCTPKKKHSSNGGSWQYNVSGSGYYGSVNSSGSGYIYLNDGTEVFVYGERTGNGNVDAYDDNGNYYSLEFD